MTLARLLTIVFVVAGAVWLTSWLAKAFFYWIAPPLVILAAGYVVWRLRK